MSYCVNCGVELAESEKKCPLCGVEVINPAQPRRIVADSPYPRRLEKISKKMDRRFFAQLAGLLLLIPLLITVLVNILSSGKLSWSGYVIGALAMVFVWVVLPFYFKKYYTVPFICADCVAAVLYLWLVELLTGADWFLAVGLPIGAGASLFAILLAAAFSGKVKLGALVKTALILFSAGLFTVCVNVITSETVFGTPSVSWSLYVLVPCLILGIAAMIIERRKNFKEEIRRRLFF